MKKVLSIVLAVAIVYSVDEVSVPTGYTKTVEANNTKTKYTITNTHTTDKTSVEVEKVWADNNDQDKIRPTSITVQLKAGDANYGDPVVLNEGNNWKYTWSNLEKNANGVAIEYSVDEVSVPTGYTKTVEANNTKTKYTITNTHTTDKTSVEVEKVWADNNDQDKIRPTSITVQLKAGDANYGDPVVLNEGNNWKYTWSNLEKNANGVAIEYSVDEVSVPTGYTKTVEANNTKTKYTITNTHTTDKISINVEKQWRDDDNRDGLRPQSIHVQLKADGKAVGDPVELSETNNWKHTWTNLDKNANGKEIEYTVEETDLPAGYGITVNGTPKEGFLIINPHEPVKIDLEGVKIWEGETDKDHQRPSSVTIRLYADGIEIDFAVVTAASGWTFKFTGLYKFNGGNEIKYTITEDPVVGYKTSINGTTVTNTWEPPETPPTGDREIIATVAMLFTSALGIAFALERKRRRKIDSV